MRKNIIRPVLALITAAMAAGACTDTWDDHYDAAVSGNGTLWQAVESNEQLSRFASVVKACGYDRILNGSQTFSVFAPTDDHLTQEEATRLINDYNDQKNRGVKDDDNTVIRQFVQNHMALFSHPVSSLTNDSITMMNGKSAVLTPSSLGTVGLLTDNALYSNGTLFTVDGTLEYFPNVFEYLGLDSDIDSVYRFLDSYSVYKFNPDKSVPGGIEDGKVVYLDSVSDLRNQILQNHGLINSEDSSYWMVVPVNDEWNRMVSDYEPLFNYDNTVSRRDSLPYANTRLAIVNGSIFSRSINTDVTLADSAVSTVALSYEARKAQELDYPYGLYYKPYAAGGVFDGVEEVECSNGKVLKATRYNILPAQSFLKTIKVEAENTLRLDSVAYAVDPVTVHKVASDNPFFDKVSGNSYIEVVPKDNSTNPNVTFNIPDILSGVPYDIYVVMVPPLAEDTLASAENRLPSRTQIKVEYHTQAGKPTSKNISGYFIPKVDVVDTMLVASGFVFPTCSYALAEPQVHMQMLSRVTGSNTSKWTRTLRIDCILLRPRLSEE